MKHLKWRLLTGVVLAMISSADGAETVEPTIQEIAMVPRLTILSAIGTTNVIEYADNLAPSQWRVLTNLVVTDNPYLFADLSAPLLSKRFYRVSVPAITNVPPDSNAPAGMVIIPAGSFTMGDALGDGDSNELPLHAVELSGFFLDATLVTKALWDEVYDWAATNGYSFDNEALGKAANHPVYTVSWYDVVKWCNARSQKAGLTPVYYTDADMTQVYKSGVIEPYPNWTVKGHRLPTEAEWEYAARGGATGRRFPWGDTITHSQANYNSSGTYSYDVSSTRGWHPDYDNDPMPYTSPVGAFAANTYGLYDLAGNLYEWCWDWYGGYSSRSQTDPRGPLSGSMRVLRGGSWASYAYGCRIAARFSTFPVIGNDAMGFRCAMSPGQ
jgi:formylglycine-generating enzyme